MEGSQEQRPCIGIRNTRSERPRRLQTTQAAAGPVALLLLFPAPPPMRKALTVGTAVAPGRAGRHSSRQCVSERTGPTASAHASGLSGCRGRRNTRDRQTGCRTAVVVPAAPEGL